MGMYALWVENKIRREVGELRGNNGFRFLSLLARAWSWLLPRPLDPGRTVLLADFEPPVEHLVDYLGRPPAHIAMPYRPRAPLPGVRYSLWRMETNPVEWAPELDAAIPGEIDT